MGDFGNGYKGDEKKGGEMNKEYNLRWSLTIINAYKETKISETIDTENNVDDISIGIKENVQNRDLKRSKLRFETLDKISWFCSGWKLMDIIIM